MTSISKLLLKNFVHSFIKNSNVTAFQCNIRFSRLSSTINFIDLDNVTYEKVCSETLDSLSDYFDEILEKDSHLKAADVSYGDGVLTVKLGEQYGTYVINRQTPNKQIWLSSPTSGPKRYDFAGDSVEKGCWIYKHSGESLHQLLQKEIKNIIRTDVNFFKLPYSGS